MVQHLKEDFQKVRVKKSLRLDTDIKKHRRSLSYGNLDQLEPPPRRRSSKRKSSA